MKPSTKELKAADELARIMQWAGMLTVLITTCFLFVLSGQELLSFCYWIWVLKSVFPHNCTADINGYQSCPAQNLILYKTGYWITVQIGRVVVVPEKMYFFWLGSEDVEILFELMKMLWVCFSTGCGEVEESLSFFPPLSVGNCLLISSSEKP